MAWQLLQYNRAFDGFWEQCDSDLQDAFRPKLAQLALKGNLARYPLTESFGEGLFELRVKHKRQRARLLFGFMPGQRIVIVLGAFKDQRRLPPAMIERARVLLNEAVGVQERIDVAIFH
jgi:hypothetical protein